MFQDATLFHSFDFFYLVRERFTPIVSDLEDMSEYETQIK